MQKEIRKGHVEGIVVSHTDPDPATSPSCVTIAICQRRGGFEVILDTNDGYIYWCGLDGQHEENAPELDSPLKRF